MRGVAREQSSAQEDGWVICRVFKKKNVVVQHQAGQNGGGRGAASNKLVGAGAIEGSRSNCSSTVTTVSYHAKATQIQKHYSASDDALDHILNQYMHGRSSTTSYKQETKPTNPSSSVLDHLIDSVCHNGSSTIYEKFMKLPPLEHVVPGGLVPLPTEYSDDWDALDRLAPYELNCLSDAASAKTTSDIPFTVDELSGATAYSGGGTLHDSSITGASDGDLWSLARSVSSLHADLTINSFSAVGC